MHARHVKSVKVSEDHHRLLKVQSALHGLSLQHYVAIILELTFSDDPAIKKPRDAFLAAIEPMQGLVMERAKRHVMVDEE